MSSDQLEHGADLRRQFKKTVIQAGYLKGARYLDVGLEDLKKAARSYRGEPRFNQFAKRALAEKLLAQDEPQSAERPVVDPPSGHLAQFFGRVCMLFRWLGSKFKGRTVLALCILVLFLLILSRPLFYVVLGKAIGAFLKVALRRSVGIVITVLDAILEEAAAGLDTGMMPVTSPRQINAQLPVQFEVQPAPTFGNLFLNLLFAILGGFAGRRMPINH